MFIPRENNPSRKEWVDEEYAEAEYQIFLRKESGDYEVYRKSSLIARVESLEEGIRVIEEHKRVS